VTASLALYRAATGLLEPLAPLLVSHRLRAGKEATDRVAERFGRTMATRTDGVVVWMHAASVGEARLLLDLFAALRQKRPDIHATLTTQTLTSAAMIAAAAPDHVVHQMAPLDGPRAVAAFMARWRPDMAIFAEGEIWPNMLEALKRRNVPAALVNARMTAKSIRGWKTRSMAARRLFAAFDFIGAADRATAEGLGAVLRRRIEPIGNLKLCVRVPSPPREKVEAFRAATAGRPIVLAASTHLGEEAFAAEAFVELRREKPEVLMILAPRHPERGESILSFLQGRGLSTAQWSKDRSIPGPGVDVLLADTIGELLFWYACCDAVYLGGASVEGVGGHNPMEPIQLGKDVFTGPHGFNFAEVFETLQATGVLSVGHTPAQLAQYWLSRLDRPASPGIRPHGIAAAQAPLETTMKAILSMLPDVTPHA